LGAWVSYSIATAFGLFFNEVIKRKVDHKSFATYLPAFVFGTLGSCIFFLITRNSFSPAHVWLAVSFGLISAVAIYSRDRDFVNRKELIWHALQLSLIYALFSAFLQLAVSASFRGWNNISFQHMAIFFSFGFVRGGSVAFIMASTFMECDLAKRWNARRKSPRLPYGKQVDGILSGQKMEIFVKDISERGASMRFNNGATPQRGDEVAFKLEDTDVKGKIYWASRKWARIKFDLDDPVITGINEIIGQKIMASA
jgi:hypothetical protein